MKIDFESHSRKSPVKKNKKNSKSILKRELPFFKSFRTKNKESFYREFGLLLQSGIDVNQSLSLMINQEKNAHILGVLKKIQSDLVKGKPLFESFKQQSDFSKYEIYSLKAGEEIRQLPKVLNELQLYFKRKLKVRRQITSVLAYPIFVLLITFGVLYFMLNYVVPMFSSIFDQFGGELPKVTRLVVYLSSKFNTFFLVIIAIILALFLVHKRLIGDTKYQNFHSKLILKIPVFGTLVKKIEIAKFSQIMGLLLSSKTPLDQALGLALDVTSFFPLKNLIESSIEEVSRGNTLYRALDKGFFEPKILTLVSIGEEINQLDNTFNNLSEQFNEEIDHSTKLIGTIVEPLMIVIIAVVVGFILIAMYYPMTNISEVINSR